MGLFAPGLAMLSSDLIYGLATGHLSGEGWAIATGASVWFCVALTVLALERPR